MQIICVGWGSGESSPERRARTEPTARKIAAEHLGVPENELSVEREVRDERYCWIVTKLPIQKLDLKPAEEADEDEDQRPEGGALRF